MATLAIALKDTILDLERSVDLTPLPEEEALALLSKSYGLFPPSIEVMIQEGKAVIIPPEEQVPAVSTPNERRCPYFPSCTWLRHMFRPIGSQAALLYSQHCPEYLR